MVVAVMVGTISKESDSEEEDTWYVQNMRLTRVTSYACFAPLHSKYSVLPPWAPRSGSIRCLTVRNQLPLQ